VEIKINFADGVPIYRQIVSQIRCLVALGLLKPDAGLPSIRALALELKVAPNTIAKAYEELEAVGVVHVRRGFGTFVSYECTPTVDGQRRHIIEQRIDALLAEANQLNFTPEALLELMFRRQAFIAQQPLD
jgi:GntR family transcriptional regulator